MRNQWDLANPIGLSVHRRSSPGRVILKLTGKPKPGKKPKKVCKQCGVSISFYNKSLTCVLCLRLANQKAEWPGP